MVCASSVALSTKQQAFIQPYEVIPLLAVKDDGGEFILTLILNFATTWRNVVRFTPRLFYPREREPVAH
jgi:hypothetical protein